MAEKKVAEKKVAEKKVPGKASSKAVSKTESRVESKVATSTTPKVSGKPAGAAPKVAPKTAPKTAAKPAAKVVSKTAGNAIGLFQYFLPGQPAALADKAMTVIKAPDAVTPLTHAGFIKELLAHPQTRDMRVWGLLPADYPQRLAMTGADIRAAIEAAPGCDAYILNPHLEVDATYQNMWVQGEVSHPGLLGLSAEVFKHVGMSSVLLTQLLPLDRMVSGYAVIGTTKFWSGWLQHLSAFLQKADSLPEQVKVALYRGNADPKGHHPCSTFLYFVTERLFGEFVLAQDKMLKIHRLHSSKQEAQLSTFVRDMRWMRELALTQGSKEMAQAWSGYRKLYLLNKHGRDWMDKHVKVLDLPFAVPMKSAKNASR